MTTSSLPKALKGKCCVKVKGCAPTPFVENSSKIIVGIHKSLVIGVAIVGFRGMEIIVRIDSVVHASRASQFAVLMKRKVVSTKMKRKWSERHSNA